MFYDLALPALGLDAIAGGGGGGASAVDAVDAASISDAASRSLDRLLVAASLGYSVVAIEREAYGRLNAAEEAGPPPGSLVSRQALAAAAATAAASGPFGGRIPRRSALRISAAEPHGGGGSGGGSVSLSFRRPSQASAAPAITQLTRLTLATGDPGEAAAVLGNRIGKAGGGGAGASSGSNEGGNAAVAAAAAGAAAAAAGSSSLPPPSPSIPFSARRSYDILAIRPLNGRVLAQAATSLDVDVIVLDFTGSGSGSAGSGGGSGSKRPPSSSSQPSSSSSFSLARMPKPAALRPALARGISLEVRYSPALSSERERRALLAGLSSLATTLRGRGGGGGSGGGGNRGECLSPFLLSSGSLDSNGLRAPLDAAALAQVAGMSANAALAAVTRVPEQVAARARKRRAASRGECGFIGGREAIGELAAMEVAWRSRKRKRKAGSGGGGSDGMLYNQQARQPKQKAQGKKKKR